MAKRFYGATRRPTVSFTAIPEDLTVFDENRGHVSRSAVLQQLIKKFNENPDIINPKPSNAVAATKVEKKPDLKGVEMFTPKETVALKRFARLLIGT